MKRSQHVLLVIVVVSVVAISALFVFEDVMNFLGGLVSQSLHALVGIGKAIAKWAETVLGSQLAFILGNLVLAVVVFASVRFHQFTKGTKRPAHLAIALATFLAGLIVLVVQSGFCTGFPAKTISEWLKDLSKVLMGLEGLVISFASFYFAMQSRTKRPLKVRGADVG